MFENPMVGNGNPTMVHTLIVAYTFFSIFGYGARWGAS